MKNEALKIKTWITVVKNNLVFLEIALAKDRENEKTTS